MLAVKGGKRNPAAAKKVAAKKVRVDEQERVKVEDEQDGLPSRIIVPRSDALAMLPGSIWQQSPFKWDPLPFGLESEKLQSDKIVDAKVQDDSLQRFMNKPDAPLIYGVCGNPSETKARYFAAYLVMLHCKHIGVKANPVWHGLYGGFDNKLLKDYSVVDPMYEPSILVLCNLASNSTSTKLEKAKDLIERFSSIPRIVVAAGEDPISFLSTKLYVECNALAYFSESIVKRTVEVI